MRTREMTANDPAQTRPGGRFPRAHGFEASARAFAGWARANSAALVGALAVAAIGFVTYVPALSIGFWTDDYLFVEAAGRLSLGQYLALYFDPRLQVTWYRPMQGMQWRLEYALFRGDAVGYHLVQLGFHLVNCILLYALVARITRKWRIGFAAAAIYVSLAAYSIAVIWVAVPDALSILFYLAGALLWLAFLESENRAAYVASVAALVAAFLSKEMAATLPALFFLIDRGFVRKPASLAALVKRYLPFAVIALVYAALEYTAVTRGVFTHDWGYGIGVNNLEVLLSYLGQMALPWKLDSPWSYLWLLLEAAAFGYALYRRELRVVVFAAIAVLIVLPVVPFRALSSRYLYLPMMPAAVAVALVLELCVHVLAQFRLTRALRLAGGAVLGAVVVFAMLSGSLATSSYGEDVAGVARETRLQFRPVFQSHAAFPPDTLLYFFNQPFTTPNISGLMFLRYGPNVSVSGSDIDRPVGLRDHKSAYVFYLDGQNGMREQPVSPDVSVRTTLTLPVRFEDGISLTGFEVVDTRAKVGGSIDLILYWETSKKLDKDYTVFAHLVGAAGSSVAGYDSQPKEGRAPTSGWKPNSTVVDTVVLPIGPDVPVGSGYRIRVGIYYLPTMQRLSVLGASGAPVTDAVDFDSFEIVPE